MDPLSLIASTEAGFFDETFLYISGGLLVLLALVTAFLGLRRDDFPSETQLKALGAVTVVLVVCTGIGAVQSARFEQAERRAENEEAAREAGAEEQESSEEEAPLGEGEGAEPGTPGGEAEGPAAEAENQPAPEKGRPNGREIFIDVGCGNCHTLADADTEGTIGPVLDDTLAGVPADYIRESIVDPSAVVVEGFPDGTMPPNYEDVFNEVQLDTLVSYLAEVAGN